MPPFALPLWRLCTKVLFIPTLLLLTACGASYDTTKVKDYRLALVDGDPALRGEFKSLVEDFNSYAGMQVLTFVDDPAQANSAIIVTQGLRERDGKVGWGQWIAETDSESGPTLPGSQLKRTVTYSMRLEFDLEYFKVRKSNESSMWTEKQKLFFHEVGHGLEMDHNPSNPRDIMYHDISGSKDFLPFFASVRQYMQDR